MAATATWFGVQGVVDAVSDIQQTNKTKKTNKKVNLGNILFCF
jgi:hypothetical protein